MQINFPGLCTNSKSTGERAKELSTKPVDITGVQPHTANSFDKTYGER